MNTSTPNAFDVLSDTLWAGHSPVLRNAALVVLGSLALWASAKTQIPFYPVPLTLQTLVVLLIGFTYGPALAASTIDLYMAQGALGLPVFAGTPEKGIGLAYMMGPTGGYLAGFLLAAVACGWLAQKGWDRRWSTMLAGMVIGNLIIYALGIAWLGSVAGWDKPVLQWGMIPFIPGDIVKILIAAILMPAIWKKVNRDQ